MKLKGPLIRLLVFAFVTVMLTAFLARTISGFQDQDSPTYDALFTNATKLQSGDDVRLAGVTVGRVRSIALTKDSLARVEISVDPEIELSTDTSAVIRYRNLIGERYVALDVPATGDPMRSGDTIPVDHTKAALDLTAVFNGFKPLFQGLDATSINALSMSLVQALQGEGGTFASLLGSTGSLGQTIAARDATIGQLVDDLTTVLATLNDRSTSFNGLITNLQAFTGGLAQDREVTVDALASIDRLSRATDSLLTQARPGLKGTIEGTRAIATSLDIGRDTLEEKLNLLPVKLNAIMRSAQYGSWFQFYNCGLGTQVDTVPGAPPLAVPPMVQKTETCGQ